MVTHCYFIFHLCHESSSWRQKSTVQMEVASRSVYVSLPTPSPFFVLDWIGSSYRTHLCNVMAFLWITSFIPGLCVSLQHGFHRLAILFKSLDKHLSFSLHISYIRHPVTQLYNERSQYWAPRVWNSAKLPLIFVFRAPTCLLSSPLDSVFNNTALKSPFCKLICIIE